MCAQTHPGHAGTDDGDTTDIRTEVIVGVTVSVVSFIIIAVLAKSYGWFQCLCRRQEETAPNSVGPANVPGNHVSQNGGIVGRQAIGNSRGGDVFLVHGNMTNHGM